ncbi:hypothetical protein [Streptomyces sp. NBC_00388]|uniref:hypothetical protein n=1 Tax=Streptomyces sp. NBC_00388 TaxID=2975735 RepID=UPI002E1EC0D8
MRRLRFGAVLVGVVLALTGFSRHSSHSHSSGGGCSSSKSHSRSTTHHDYDDDSYGSSSGYTTGSTTGSSSRSTTGSTGGTRSRTPDPTATGTVVRCAKKGDPVATVRVSATAPSGRHSYRVRMSFLDADGSVTDTGDAVVQVTGNASVTARVPMSVPSEAVSVTKCRIDSVTYAY